MGEPKKANLKRSVIHLCKTERNSITKVKLLMKKTFLK